MRHGRITYAVRVVDAVPSLPSRRLGHAHRHIGDSVHAAVDEAGRGSLEREVVTADVRCETVHLIEDVDVVRRARSVHQVDGVSDGPAPFDAQRRGRVRRGADAEFENGVRLQPGRKRYRRWRIVRDTEGHRLRRVLRTVRQREVRAAPCGGGNVVEPCRMRLAGLGVEAEAPTGRKGEAVADHGDAIDVADGFAVREARLKHVPLAGCKLGLDACDEFARRLPGDATPAQDEVEPSGVRVLLRCECEGPTVVRRHECDAVRAAVLMDGRADRIVAVEILAGDDERVFAEAAEAVEVRAFGLCRELGQLLALVGVDCATGDGVERPLARQLLPAHKPSLVALGHHECVREGERGQALDEEVAAGIGRLVDEHMDRGGGLIGEAADLVAVRVKRAYAAVAAEADDHVRFAAGVRGDHEALYGRPSGGVAHVGYHDLERTRPIRRKIDIRVRRHARGLVNQPAKRGTSRDHRRRPRVYARESHDKEGSSIIRAKHPAAGVNPVP